MFHFTVSNPCASGNVACSHICLLSTHSRGYGCACPAGMVLLTEFTCIPISMFKSMHDDKVVLQTLVSIVEDHCFLLWQFLSGLTFRNLIRLPDLALYNRRLVLYPKEAHCYQVFNSSCKIFLLNTFLSLIKHAHLLILSKLVVITCSFSYG